MEDKKRYLVTMRWYIEMDEELVAGKNKADEILDVIRRKEGGQPACATCPTRHPEGIGILDYHHFMGKKPIYMSVDRIKDK